MFKVLRNGLLLYILHARPKLWCNPCSKCYGVDCFTLHTCPKLWCNQCSKCYGVDCFGTYFTHVQSCDVTRLQSAKERTASVHTSHMSKAVLIPVFKVPGNGLLRYILHTRSKLLWYPCSKCYGVDCFGTYTSHMSKAVMWPVFKVLWSGLLRYILHTCPKLWCNQCSKCYGMDCFTLHTCPKLWCNQCSKCYGVDCFGTYFTHVQSCDVTRVQSATQLTASVYFTAHVLGLWSPWTGLHFWHEGRNICNGTVLFGSSLIWFPAGICTNLSIVRYHFHRHFFAELTNFHLFASYWDLWMMVNEHRLQLSQQHGFTKEAMRKNSFKYDPLCPTIQSIHLY